MRTILFLFALLLVGSAMAANDSVGGLGGLGGMPLPNAVNPKTNKQVEEDADLLYYITQFQQGKMSMDDAVKAFRSKWYGGKDPDPNDFKNPEILLPDTRDTQRQLNWK